MRPGLATIGSLLLAVGLLVVAVALLNWPSPTEYTQNSSTSPSVSPDSSWQAVILAPYGHSANAAIGVSWTASGGVNVYLLTCSPTPPALPPAKCIAAQGTTGASTGTITISPATTFPYTLYLVNQGTTSVSVDLSISAVASSNTGLSLWEASVVILAGIFLAMIGAIAAFLGWFLKGNPYQRPPATGTPPTEESPEEDKVFW